MSNLKDLDPTKGINFECITMNSLELNIFEVSGDQAQYNILNIVTKNVDIKAIIFVIDLDQASKMEDSKQLLEKMLGNQYLDIGLSLFIVYNLREKSKENLKWLTKDILDSKLRLEKIQEKWALKYIGSCIYDCSVSNGDIVKKMENFANQLLQG